MAEWLEQNPIAGRTFAVFGALADKDVAGIVAPLALHIDHWLLARTRCADAARTVAQPNCATRAVQRCPHADFDVASPTSRGAASRATRMRASIDRIVAFGSFYVAAAALRASADAPR